MPQRLIAVAAWACLAFIVYATLSPLSARPELTSIETALVVFIERFGAYALLGCLFWLAYPRRILIIGLIVSGSAVLLEFLQIFVSDRDARISDALVKLAGGLVGIFLARAIRTFSGYRSKKLKISAAGPR
jgi:VanZ family protein